MKILQLAAALTAVPSIAHAAPGLDDAVYGATIQAGKTEFEARYGRVLGATANAEEANVVEVARGFSSHFYGAALVKFGTEPATSRRLETLALESIFTLARINSLDIDTALYVEAEHNIHGPDNLETKLLIERRKGPVDTRLNIIAERAIQSGAPVEFGYAAAADYELADDVRVGAEAFGDLGSSHKITGHAQHFVGPVAKVELDHAGPGELEMSAGYLFAVAGARGEAKGQLRFGIEYEF